MTEKTQVFVSGALSTAVGKVRLEVFYERIGSLCERKDLEAFVPHRDAGASKIPDLTPGVLYEINMKKIEESNLVIAYAGYPSMGVGMEVQKAKEVGIDVIILSDKGKPISRPLKGCPAIIEHIEFMTFEDALNQLDGILDKWLSKKKTKAKI